MRVWRQKFARSIPKLDKESTRTATQILTGHCELNFRINKFKPTARTVPKTCPHCLMEKETMNHFIGQCPKWSYQRGGYFESFYLSVTDLVDKFSLPRITGFIQANAGKSKFDFPFSTYLLYRGKHRAPMLYLTVVMIYPIVIMTTAPRRRRRC